MTFAQETTEEATEAAPETTAVEETTTATTTAPRTVSAKDLNELEGAQFSASNAQAVVQHILTRIITEYQINVQTEVLNIKTGEITVRPTATQ